MEDNKIKDTRNLFRLKKKKKVIEDRINRDVGNLFDKEKQGYRKPVRVVNFWSNNYIRYGSDRDRNKKLLFEEYLHEVRPNLRDIIKDPKKVSYAENSINRSNYLHAF